MKNKNQVLSLLCRRLEEKGYVDPAFEKQVYRREEAAATAFQNIAIPHSVQMDAIKLVSLLLFPRQESAGETHGLFSFVNCDQ